MTWYQGIYFHVTCVHMHTHTHTHTHMYVYIYIYISVYTCVCLCACAHTHTHTHMYVCMYIYIYACAHKHTCMYFIYLWVIYIYIYIVYVLSALLYLLFLMDLTQNTQTHYKVSCTLLSTHTVANTVEVLCKICITAFGCNFTPHSTSFVASVDLVCYFECCSFLNHATGNDRILLNIAYNFCAIGKIQIQVYTH